MARIFFIVFIFSGLYAQCSEMDGMECGNDNNCEWVEDIETGNCGNLYDDDCELNPECNWNCDFVDDYMGWCNYSCDGGPTITTIITPTHICLLYTSPSPRDRTRSRMPSSA